MSRFKFNDEINDIVEEYRKQVGRALKVAEQKIRIRMKEIIQEYMLDDYYGGYEPKVYIRTNQLENSVGPYTELKSSGNVFGIAFGIETDSPFGPGAMHHTRYQTKKSGEPCKHSYPASEEDIFENFLAGIHPNVGRAGTSHISARVQKALDYFLDFEAVDIVNNELNKIK
jgi:hypothetical protein